MNVPKPTKKTFFFIVAGIVLLAIPLTVFLLQNQQIFQPHASSTPQVATSSCDATSGHAVINVSYSNSTGAPVVTVFAKDLQSGKTMNLGTVPQQQSGSGVIDTGSTSLNANGVVFTLTSQNYNNSVTANYNAVSTCPATTTSANFCPASGQNNQGLCAWDPLHDAQGYQVTVTETESGKVVDQQSVASSSAKSTFPMTPGTSYTCAVAGINAVGKPGTLTKSPAKVCPVTPTPSPEVCPANQTPLGFCRWDSVPVASSYNVTIKNITTGEVKTGTVNAPSTEFSFPDVVTQTYQCSVSAVNACTTGTTPTTSTPSTCSVPSPTPTPTPTPSPTLSPTPTLTPTPTPTPSPTPTLVPTSTPLPTPTPIVVVKTIPSPPQIIQQPPQQIVVRSPGTQTIVQQPGIQTVVQQPAPRIPTPQPTMAPTGNTTGTIIMVGASSILLLAGGLIFFIL